MCTSERNVSASVQEQCSSHAQPGHHPGSYAEAPVLQGIPGSSGSDKQTKHRAERFHLDLYRLPQHPRAPAIATLQSLSKQPCSAAGSGIGRSLSQHDSRLKHPAALLSLTPGQVFLTDILSLFHFASSPLFPSTPEGRSQGCSGEEGS